MLYSTWGSRWVRINNMIPDQLERLSRPSVMPLIEDGSMEKKLKLADVLEAHRGEKHLVVLHDFPDPDAISSASAHRLISAEYDIDVDVVYTGKISHSQVGS